MKRHFGWFCLTLLLASGGLVAPRADLVNGIEVWATSSDESILPAANVSFSGSGSDVVVTLTTLPNVEGTVEVNFWANINGQAVRLVPRLVQGIAPQAPVNLGVATGL